MGWGSPRARGYTQHPRAAQGTEPARNGPTFVARPPTPPRAGDLAAMRTGKASQARVASLLRRATAARASDGTTAQSTSFGHGRRHGHVYGEALDTLEIGL